MKFLVSGVKKWVTSYSSWQYHCDKCGRTFRPPEYPQTASLYGDGLVTWDNLSKRGSRPEYVEG